MADTKLLALNNLNVWYTKGKNVLSGFSLALDAHEVVGLIGLNGAGKTTLLKTIAGLLPSFHCGGLSWNGQPFSFRGKAFKSNRYVVFAEDHSFQYFTFWEYLSYVTASYQKTLPDISDLVQGFHFEEYADVPMKELSTGNLKKAYLITAFSLRLPLLLLDEPVNGLDFQSTEYLYKLISGYRKYGTVLFSSHILESICLTSDRVLVLEQGAVTKTFHAGEITPENIREVLACDENN